MRFRSELESEKDAECERARQRKLGFTAANHEAGCGAGTNCRNGMTLDCVFNPWAKCRRLDPLIDLGQALLEICLGFLEFHLKF